MKIGSRTIGNGRTFIIAEAGVNHNGEYTRAVELIKKAAEAGADAIKFQTYKADDLVVKGTPKFWKAESKVDDHLPDQHSAYKALENFPMHLYRSLIEKCKEYDIEFLSTPFSIEAADYLNSLGMKAFKIASSDLSTIPFLRHIARFGKPMILSTGAASLEEIKQSVRAIEDEGNENIILLHCTLCYPTKDEDANYACMATIKKEFPWYPVGISDHTLGVFPTTMAVAMGAQVVEKHYTVDKTLGMSADHWLSVDPTELKEIVDNARRIEVLRGSPLKVVIGAESETRQFDKRSIVTKVDIPEGTEIQESMLTYKRPGTGIWPTKWNKVIGRKTKVFLPADTILQWEHFLQK